LSLLIDTSIIADIENENKKTISVLDELRKSHPGPPSIAFITYLEFIHGLREKNPENRKKSMSFIEFFRFVNPTKTTAIILSDLRHKYEKTGEMFTLADLMIASQSMENNMTLVTSDKQFHKISELKKVIV